jgi:ubiquinone/menaquinone biosynthesis C-methylase UbiE
LLACLVAPLVRPQGVVAIDLADGAISVASYRAGNAGIRNIRFEMLDSRNIVYHGKLFEAAVSNLGIPNFGADRVFQEVHRVLKPGGRFVFSEWPTDYPTTFALPRQLMTKYGTATPSKDLTLLREARALARNDSEGALLGDPANVRKALHKADFDRSETRTKSFPVPFRDLDDLIAFTTSFGWCERELREMSAEGRTAFEAELVTQIEPLRTANGFEDTWTLNFFVAHRD